MHLQQLSLTLPLRPTPTRPNHHPTTIQLPAGSRIIAAYVSSNTLFLTYLCTSSPTLSPISLHSLPLGAHIPFPDPLYLCPYYDGLQTLHIFSTPQP